MMKTEIVNAIIAERKKQDKKWGEQNHHPYVWMAILAEEVGETNQALLEHDFGGKPEANYKEELIQVAAVAIAALESFDRGKWRE